MSVSYLIFCVFLILNQLQISQAIEPQNQAPASVRNVGIKWAPLQIKDAPTTEDIARTAFFERQLTPSRQPTLDENNDLLLALQSFAKRTVRDDFSSLTLFLEFHPDSPWAMALETQLGREFYRTGHYSRSIDSWNHVWESKKSSAQTAESALSNISASHLAMMYARLGRMSELRTLLAELQKRPDKGKVTRDLSSASEGLWSMEHQPEVSFRCGPLALDRICFATDRSKAGNTLIQDSQSTTNGFSALQVASLSRELGLNYQVAFRTQGAEIILPSVVHWKVGHYAALITRDGALIRADDPTFGNKTWLSDQTLDEEASGYFLVPSGPLPRGWRTVSDTEASGVWGKGTTSMSDKKSTTQYDNTAHPCNGGQRGMASWDIHLLLGGIHMEDTPVGYTPPVGPPIYFKVYYDSIDAFGLQSVPYSNVAPDWYINWLAYITDDPMNPAGDIDFAADGGGTLTFTDFNPTNLVFLNQFRNRADLVRTGTNSYEVRYPDGSKKIFDMVGQQIGTARQIFMTAVVDPAGNAATVQFEFPGKITSITDAIGQQTKLYYEFAYDAILLSPYPPFEFHFPGTNELLLTRVVDPFGRTASFQVNSPTNFYPIPGDPIVSAGWAQLTNITDEIGLSSSFSYANPMTITTPYGQTQFTPGSYNGLYRANWVEVTYPNGEKERIEYSEKTPAQIFSSEPLAIVPKGIPVRNYILWARNTYYWDRKAYAQYYSPNDYTGARIYHWTHGADYTTASPIIESYKEPLEHRVWFNYEGQVNATFAGTSDRPTNIARTMEDGTTQIYHFEYNPLGNVTKSVDPLGRTLSFIYDTNDIDLLEVRQTQANQNEVIFRATYNSQHRPLTLTDTAGQTSSFSYNTRGQPLTASDALGDITTYTYDANGYLLSIDGPLAGTNDTSRFTYDGIGRLHSATDPDGYTLLFNYDNLDRLTQITYPDNTSDSITYDRLDASILTDRANQQTHLIHDSLRQLVAVQDAQGRVTRYQWCGCGRLETTIDPLGHATYWLRDAQGRLQTKVYPDGSKLQYTYDTATGWLKAVRDEQNQVTSFDYNLDGTLRQRSYINAIVPTPPVIFTYDTNYPRITSMQDAVGLTTFSYGPITANPSFSSGKLVSIDGPLPNDTISFEYDADGREAARTVGTTRITRTWDPAGRLIQLTNVLGSFIFSWDQTSFRIAKIQSPGGFQSTFTYFPNQKERLVQQITNLKPDSSLLSRFTYDYNTLQQVTQWTQERAGANPLVFNANYDIAGELTNIVATQASTTVDAHTFSFDAAGNRTDDADLTSDAKTFYNELNQPTAISSPVSPSTYEYDPEDRLVAWNQGTHRTEITYDGLGRRARITEKENGSVVSDRRYVWCRLDLQEERDSTGAVVTKRYSHLGVHAEAGADLPPGSYFYSRDRMQSVTEMSDSLGVIRAAYNYSPFGVRTKALGDLESEVGFAGLYYHQPSGLGLGAFRDFSATLGRWLSRDPLGESQGFNLYAYSGNDPLNYVDPLGLDGTRTGSLTQNLQGYQDAKAGLDAYNSAKSAAKTAESLAEKGVKDFAKDELNSRGEDAIKEIAPGEQKEMEKLMQNAEDRKNDSIDPFGKLQQKLYGQAGSSLNGDNKNSPQVPCTPTPSSKPKAPQDPGLIDSIINWFTSSDTSTAPATKPVPKTSPKPTTTPDGRSLY